MPEYKSAEDLLDVMAIPDINLENDFLPGVQLVNYLRNKPVPLRTLIRRYKCFLQEIYPNFLDDFQHVFPEISYMRQHPEYSQLCKDISENAAQRPGLSHCVEHVFDDFLFPICLYVHLTTSECFSGCPDKEVRDDKSLLEPGNSISVCSIIPMDEGKKPLGLLQTIW